MSAILRWFHDGNVRYRVYFRVSDDTPARRHLVIAAPDWQVVTDAPAHGRLEDFSEDELRLQVRRLRGTFNNQERASA